MTTKRHFTGRQDAGRSFAGSLFRDGAVTIAGVGLYNGREYYGLQFIGRQFRNLNPVVVPTNPMIGRWTKIVQIVGARRRVEVTRGPRAEVEL